MQRSVETEDPEEQPTAPLRTKLRRKENAKQPEEQKPAARAMREKKAATPEEQEKPQRKLMRAEAAPESEEAPTEEAAAPAGGATEEKPSIEERIEQTRGRGEALPETVRLDMERQFGQDLSHVIVHTDAEAAQLCKELQARAFTIGRPPHSGAGR